MVQGLSQKIKEILSRTFSFEMYNYDECKWKIEKETKNIQTKDVGMYTHTHTISLRIFLLLLCNSERQLIMFCLG